MSAFESSKAGRVARIRDEQNKLRRRLFAEFAVSVMLAEDPDGHTGKIVRLPHIEISPLLENDIAGGKLVLSIASNACPALRLIQVGPRQFIEGSITKGGVPCSFSFPLDYLMCVRDPDTGEVAMFEHLQYVVISEESDSDVPETPTTKKKPHLTVVK